MIIAAALWASLGCSEAVAWGCDGHRAVVYIAERLLSAHTLAAARALLAASPVDPSLSRFCSPVAGDPLVDDASWADDYRAADPHTAGWHFINVPLQTALSTTNEHTYCAAGNCIVDQIAVHYRVLTGAATPAKKAEALRFLLHLIGDLHQPLHAATNGDRGGNCVPVAYYDRAPQESQTTPNDFSPNLHGVWDTSTIRTVMAAHGAVDPRALADYIVSAHALPATVPAQGATKRLAIAWAAAAHRQAQTVAYGRLPMAVGMEPASALTLDSCADNHDIVHRMLAKHIAVGAAYEQWSTPVILDQLRSAGLRLAAAIKAAFP